MSNVEVRYWAAAREAAGVETEPYEAATLAELLRSIHDRHDDRLKAILGASSLLIDGVAVGHRDPSAVHLAAGSTVEVLPPFAGG